jgi:23S rRNA (guanine2445-N2)-methyltransferase / 23S rRNA (guanine2069-N7)-methyltransferase
VLLVIGGASIASSDDLYELSRSQDWEEHLGSDSSFAIDGACSKGAPISHSRFAALRVKDGIVDYFRDKHGVRPDVDTQRPDIRINVHVGENRTVLAVDLSGEGLHRRGYRLAGGEAPLRENLAAAMVILSGWDADTPLLDPMCGSATILVEAALIAGNSAPGLGRTYYGFTGWRGHDKGVWGALVEDALEKEREGARRDWPPIWGYDADAEVIGYARENIRRAGLEDRIEVGSQELLKLRTDLPPPGWLVCNPPYGERLAEHGSVKYLYRCLGNHLHHFFGGWHTAILTSQIEYADMLRLTWGKSYRLYNGPLGCRLYTGVVQNRIETSGWQLLPKETADGESDFSNRLRKNFKQLQRWSQKNDLQNFRIYDRDLQEYNVSVDLFHKYVFVREFRSSKRIDPDMARRRFNTVLQGVRSVLGVGRDRVFTRKQLGRTSRSESARKKSPRLYEVWEHQRAHLLDFSGTADVGIDQEQRGVREFLVKEASGKRFLSLFGHTGTAAIAAAHGEAAGSITIESVHHYLAWAEKNFALNGMHSGKHSIVNADYPDWLRGQKKRFDLVFADLTRARPTPFTQGRLVELVNLVQPLLPPGGVFYYTAGGDGLEPGADLRARLDCSEITAQLIPKDCTGSPGRFRFWRIQNHPE